MKSTRLYIFTGLATVLNISAFGCFFVWLSETDFMFGHFKGPPEFIMAAPILSCLGVVSTILWFTTQFPSRAQPNRPRTGVRVLRSLAILAITAPALFVVPIGALEWSDAAQKLHRASLARAASEARDVPNLLVRLEDENPEIRREAARKLSELYWVSSDAVPKMIEVASRRDEPTCLYIVQALGKLEHRGKDAIATLVALLGEPVPVGLAAGEALTKIGKDATLALLDASRSSDARVRQSTARAFGAISPPAIGMVPRLTEMLSDSNSRVRTAAANSLGKQGIASQRALPELDNVLNDSDPQARAAAKKAIRKISRAMSNYFRESLLDLHSQDKAARVSAAKVLGNRGADARAHLSALRTLFEDPEPSVRFEAAKAVYKIGDDPDDVIPTFIELLNLGEAHRKILYRIILYLADIGPPAIGTVPTLEGLLNHEDPAVRRNANVAIIFITDPPLWKIREMSGEAPAESPFR